MGFNSKINWSKDFTLDNSTTFHSEYEKKSDVFVAPFMLSVPGFVKALFLRKFTDAGPLVLETVVFNRVDGPSFAATCSQDLILVNLYYSATEEKSLVILPDPSACPGKVFIVKDISGFASSLNYIIVGSFSGATIDGNFDFTIATSGGAAWFMSDGTNYKILEVL